MKISPITLYRQNNPSFGKFKDEKTARTVYEHFQKYANKYQREPFYKALRDCDYITFSTDPQTGKVIGTPRTDEEFKQSDLGKMAEYYINKFTDWGSLDDLTTDGFGKYYANAIAIDIMNIAYKYKLKQENPEEYARQRRLPTQEERDKAYWEEKRREQEEMEDKIRTWYAQ